MASGPQDNPDFVRLPQVVPFIVYPPTTTALPDGAVHNFGPFYVGNLPALLVGAQSFLNAQLCQVVVSFFNDTSFLTAVNSYTLTFDSTHKSQVYLPVTGNFVQFSLSALGGGAVNLSAQLFANGVAAGGRSTAFASLQTQVIASDAGVASNAFVTHDLPVTLPGLWRLTCVSGGVGINYLLQAQLASGVWTIYDQGVGAAVSQLAAQVHLPACPIRMVVVNTNAGAQNLLSALVPAY